MKAKNQRGAEGAKRLLETGHHLEAIEKLARTTRGRLIAGHLGDLETERALSELIAHANAAERAYRGP